MERPGGPRRLTEAGVQQRRLAAWKHGQRASLVTEADAFHYRLEQIDPELPDLLDQYARATSGDLSASDLERAIGLATKAIIRGWIVEEILERGVAVESVIKDKDGKEIGRRIRANPLLKALSRIDHQLGYTVDQAGLSRRSQERGRPGRETLLRCGVMRGYGRRGSHEPIQNTSSEPGPLELGNHGLGFARPYFLR